MNENLKVSICMITYGHEDYIREAIEGVLMQECNFEIELILANDCSPDATDDVIQDILANHPKQSCIKYFKHEKNLGMMPNFIFALKHCTGKYVAMCEGDDYWTDPLKLQKQVDFLENNPEFIIHSGDANIHIANKVTAQLLVADIAGRQFKLEDFYLSNHLVTCTVMFRNTKLNFPNFFKNIVFGDWFLYLLLLQSQPSAKAYRAQDIFAVYRKHQHSVTGSMSVIDDKKNHIKQIIFIKNFVAPKNHKAIFQFKLNSWCITCFRLQIDANKNIDAFNILMLNIWHCGINIFWRKYFSKIKHDLKFSLLKTL